MIIRAALALLLTTNICAADCTVPGALNPDVTQATIRQTICIPGWTAQVRPSVTYTNGIKRRLLPPGSRMSDFELDHCIPLALGGHPRSTNNLWLQPWHGKCGALAKDDLETILHRSVCNNFITLAEAQRRVRTWCTP